MNTFARIKKLVLESGVPEHKVRSTLARICKITPQAVGEWESGKTKRISPDYLALIAHEFDESIEYLITGKGSKRLEFVLRQDRAPYESGGRHELVRASHQAPVVDGKLVATAPDYGRHDPIGQRAIEPEFSEIADRLIYFRALDNSMYSPSIRKSLNIGDVALIELGATPTPGDLVLCLLAGADEAILRVYKARGKGDFDLAPYNEDWASVSISDPASCKILGVSREVHIKL